MDSQVLGERLQVRFDWIGDRYEHSVLAHCGDGSVVALRSAEGTSLESWPASPPLQQLSFLDLPDSRRVALLVGMAGQSHWSLSVTSGPDELVFEAACRVNKRPERLCSEYREMAARLRQDANSARFGLFEGKCELSVSLLHPNGSSRIITSGDRTAVVCRDAPPGVQTTTGPTSDRPATMRWDYRIRLTCAG
jgi:hypothetical protein